MNGTSHLVPFIDNGGKRSYVGIRKNANVHFLWERRSINDRRKRIDRRKIPNQTREDGLERRVVLWGKDRI